MTDDPHGKVEALSVKTESGFTMAGLSEVFVQSGFFKDIKQQSQAIVKILLGRELGLKEIQAMLAIHMVEGRPEIAAATLGALIKRSGKYDYRVTEHTAEACAIDYFEIIDGQRESIGTSRFEMADAVRAGLASRPNYKAWPKNMMFARAMSNGVKWYCLDAIGSFPVYTEGELPEIAEVTPIVGPEAPDPHADLEPKEMAQEVVTVHEEAAQVPPAQRAETPAPESPHFPSSGELEKGSAMAVEDPKVVFELNGVNYQTNGVTKDQMLRMFGLSPKVNKKTGKKSYDKELLKEEFGLTTRKDLTFEQAERYLVRLAEIAESE